MPSALVYPSLEMDAPSANWDINEYATVGLVPLYPSARSPGALLSLGVGVLLNCNAILNVILLVGKTIRTVGCFCFLPSLLYGT